MENPRTENKWINMSQVAQNLNINIHEIVLYGYDDETKNFMAVGIDNRIFHSMHASYEPTSYYFLKKLFRAFPFEEKDHLIDFGCGKGRVLFMAAISGCKHVTGYEVNMERYDILKRNVEMY